MWQMLPTFLSSEPCIFKACKPWSLEAAFRTSVEEILITLGQLLSIHQKPVLKLQNKQKIGFLSFKLQRCSSRPSRNRLVEWGNLGVQLDLLGRKPQDNYDVEAGHGHGDNDDEDDDDDDDDDDLHWYIDNEDDEDDADAGWH